MYNSMQRNVKSCEPHHSFFRNVHVHEKGAEMEVYSWIHVTNVHVHVYSF